MPPLRCYLAFSYWNRVARAYRPLPDGVRVRGREADLLTPDDTVGEGVIAGGQGEVCVVIEDLGERWPELYFEIEFGDRVIELQNERLVDSAFSQGPVLGLPKVWTTRNRYAETYQRGRWKEGRYPVVGSPEQPVRFRVSFDCFVRFVDWSEKEGGFVDAPEGTTVVLLEHDGRSTRVLAQDHLDDKGRAQLSSAEELEHRPDLSVELRWPGGEWSSREHFRKGSLTERGYWEDYVGSRIGRWGSPYTFDLSSAQPRRVQGNRVRPLVDGPEIEAALREAITSARRSIHLEIMLLYDDVAGRAVVDLLCEKARQGVEVRLLFDVGTTASSYSLAVAKSLWARGPRRLDDARRQALLEEIEREREAEKIRGDTTRLREQLAAEPNISFIDSNFPYVEVAPRAEGPEPEAYESLREALPFFTVARVDHRKLLVVDGQRALLGGANIGSEYLYPEAFDPAVPVEQEEGNRWHDCFVELRGPVVRPLQARFRERWVSEGGDAFDLGGWADPEAPADHPYFPDLEAQPEGVAVSVLDTTPAARLRIHEQLRALVEGAKREILLENPYFSSREVLHWLCEAARRGVRVVCIFPDEHSDSWDFLYAARLKYPTLIEAGVEVYEYDNHFTHAKVAIFDDDAWIGSANLNHASLFNHYELVAVIHDAEQTAAFRRRLFEQDLRHSTRIAIEDVEGLLDIEDWAKGYLRQVVDRWY